MKRLFLLASAVLAAVAPLSGVAAAQDIRPAWAQPQQERDRGGDRDVRPVREIIDMVRRQVGGEFVSVQRLEQSADPPFYILRWRFDGERVEDLRVNAVSGRVMGR